MRMYIGIRMYYIKIYVHYHFCSCVFVFDINSTLRIFRVYGQIHVYIHTYMQIDGHTARNTHIFASTDARSSLGGCTSCVVRRMWLDVA